MLSQTAFEAVVVLLGSMCTVACALAYSRRVRLPRPPVGTFNGRDLVILSVFVVALPLAYLRLPGNVLTGLLVVTFASGMFTALRPLLRRRLLLMAMGGAMAADFLLAPAAHAAHGTPAGLASYWVINSLIVLVTAVGVANLYVQGGLRARHVAWFAVFLAAYDAIFTGVLPTMADLATAFAGRPLTAAVGFATPHHAASVGVGDLLVYALFATAAYRGYGRKGAAVALSLTAVFGALLPVFTPLVISGVQRRAGADGTVVPAQVFFGPAAFAGYLWLRRRGAAAARVPRSTSSRSSARVALGLR
jgi:hypothetical protein